MWRIISCHEVHATSNPAPSLASPLRRSPLLFPPFLLSSACLRSSSLSSRARSHAYGPSPALVSPQVAGRTGGVAAVCRRCRADD